MPFTRFWATRRWSWPRRSTPSAVRWLLGFCSWRHQQAVGLLRSRKVTDATDALDRHTEPADRRGTPFDALVVHERLREVQEVLTTLSELERAVIEADLDEGSPVAADVLAARLKTTAGSVYAARRRARRKLMKRCSWIRDRLQDEGWEDGKTKTPG